MIDGAFFLRRFHHSFPDLDRNDPHSVASAVTGIAAYHVAAGFDAASIPAARAAAQGRQETTELYRIFFYDCPPLTKRVQLPVSKKALYLGGTAEAKLRLQIHAALHATRKVAVRQGRLNEAFSAWRAKPDAVKRWIDDPKAFAPTDEDFEIDVVQKGVDMRLGLDVASMAFKQQVQRITLIAADADFVPAVKLARREGIDVVLDSMGAHAAPDLLQHVDGIRTAVIERLMDGPIA
ncbi:NYN domain-containing protein [Sphingomonas sp.]|uniref:NYN domain-containing protein n=1 Tax=Sphingomonas sp. TaxID=28214 RepID=UPI0035BBF234